MAAGGEEPAILPEGFAPYAQSFSTASMAAGGEEPAILPEGLAPYAQRMYDRYPEVFFMLGHPSLPENFHLPPCGGSTMEIQELQDEKVIRIHMAYRGSDQIAAPVYERKPPVVDPPSASVDDLRSLAAALGTLVKATEQLLVCSAVAPTAAQTNGTRWPDGGDAEMANVPSQQGWPGGVYAERANVPSQHAPVAVASIGPGHGLHSQVTVSRTSSLQRRPGSDHSETLNDAMSHMSSVPNVYVDTWSDATGDECPRPPVPAVDGPHRAHRAPPSPASVSPAAIPWAWCKPGAAPVGAPSNGCPMRAGLQGSSPLEEDELKLHVDGLDQLGDVQLDVGSGFDDDPLSEPVGPRSPDNYSPWKKPLRTAKQRGGALRRMKSDSGKEPKTVGMAHTMTEPACKVLGTKALETKAIPVSLKTRRGITLALAGSPSGDEPPSSSPEASCRSMQRRTKRFSFGSPCETLLESSQPAVQLIDKDPGKTEDAKPVPRPLPGAFTTRRTLFFFDWDDTLCPTSWIRTILKGRLDENKKWWGDEYQGMDWRDKIPDWFHQPLPDDTNIHDMIEALQQAVINVIDAAQTYGVCCIVTNAVPGWVGKTIKKWMPRLTQYILGHGARPPIRVLYAQEHYLRNPALADLPWDDEDLGECMWWKEAAMLHALQDVDDLYRLKQKSSGTEWCSAASMKRLTNIISTGDDTPEMKAATIVAHKCRSQVRLTDPAASRASHKRTSKTAMQSARAARRSTSAPGPGEQGRKPWLKLVKFSQYPNVKQVRRELEELAEMMPELVAARGDLRLNVGGQEECYSPRSRDKLLQDLLLDRAPDLPAQII